MTYLLRVSSDNTSILYNGIIPLNNIHMYVYIYTHIHVYMIHVYIHISVYVCVYTHIRVYRYILFFTSLKTSHNKYCVSYPPTLFIYIDSMRV